MIIPFAFDSGFNLCSVSDGEKGRSYFCPSCHSDVIFKKGSVKAPHFSHKPNSFCNGETVAHATAKFLVKKSVLDFISGVSSAPVILFKCSSCYKDSYQEFNSFIPYKIDDCILEYKVGDFIVDVALMSSGSVVAAVEIRMTHSVDEFKRLNLAIPFIELDALDVISNHLVWSPLYSAFFVSSECSSCYEKYNFSYDRLKSKSLSIAKDCLVVIPDNYYFRYGVDRCWKCKNEIILFCWEHAGILQRPDFNYSLPRTIRFRNVRSGSFSGFFNICPFCNSVQGWSFMSLFDGCYFYNSFKSFRDDMVKISRNCIDSGII